jgi:tetratricopeptide (TPR) repeat protein
MKLSDDGDDGVNMVCRTVEEEDVIERYLAGRLSTNEAEAFEQHYLECQKCFADLQLQHATAIELTYRPVHSLHLHRKPWALSLQWAAATVAVLLLVAGVLYLRPHEKTQVPAQQIAAAQRPSAAVLEQLAAVDQIPSYIPGLIRGGETNPALIKFQEGMTLYSAGKYADALAPLKQAEGLDSLQSLPIPFYLGIAYLVSGDPQEAIAQFSKVPRENAYSEEAHWYLSKAYLKSRNFSSARTELQTVESLHGAHSAAAHDILQQIKNY